MRVAADYDIRTHSSSKRPTPFGALTSRACFLNSQPNQEIKRYIGVNTRDARIYALDGLRGLAALSVVLWHWQHFYMIDGALPPTFDRAVLPLYSVLWPIYEGGDIAVDLFFAISGYVFFYVYLNRIEQRSVSAGSFLLLRLSRLYPLYFATLIIVAVLQVIFLKLHGEYFVYPANDATRFIASVLMMQDWPVFPHGYTFNGPAWSISVEVTMYLLFFILCRCCALRYWWQSALAAFCGLLAFKIDHDVGRGIIGFFLGGTVYLLLSRLSSISRQLEGAIYVATAVGWGIVVSEFEFSWLHHLALELLSLAPRIAQAWYTKHADEVFLLVFLSTIGPLTIATLVIFERTSTVSFKHLAWVGEVSYSSYLLHFPVQLVIAILMVKGTVPVILRDSVWFLAGFCVVLTTLSLATFRYLERPVQNQIRKRWLSTRRAASSA